MWEVRTALHADGWSAEFRIPFSQLRFSLTPGEPVVWGFNIRRDIVYNAEMIRWVATPRGAQGFVSRFGHLTFEQPPATPRRLELQPFTLARHEDVSGTGSGGDLSGGLDFRMGLGTATTLSATVNPDFGQVEQDPAVLNLSVFETFFPEKRAFFIEDSRTFVPTVSTDADVSFAAHRPAPEPVCDPRGRDRDRASRGDHDSRGRQGRRGRPTAGPMAD